MEFFFLNPVINLYYLCKRSTQFLSSFCNFKDRTNSLSVLKTHGACCVIVFEIILEWKIIIQLFFSQRKKGRNMRSDLGNKFIVILCLMQLSTCKKCSIKVENCIKNEHKSYTKVVNSDTGKNSPKSVCQKYYVS